MRAVSKVDLKLSRAPVFAGTFYPRQGNRLRAMVSDLLGEANDPLEKVPKAMIAPHAGYTYSGPIAGSSFIPLTKDNKALRRIILVGPSHRVAFEGIALSEAAEFVTPMGNVPVDQAALAELSSLSCVNFFEAAHAQEHSLEVELPFLQHLLADFQLVPLVVGDASDKQIEAVLDRLWGGPETLIVVSSDLSHYHNYSVAKRIDNNTAQAIEELRPEQIQSEHACGYLPIRGLLRSARHHGLKPRTIDLRNSGDTSGAWDRVVGYGAFAFLEN
jgi:Predicted dioxygenase